MPRARPRGTADPRLYAQANPQAFGGGGMNGSVAWRYVPRGCLLVGRIAGRRPESRSAQRGNSRGSLRKVLYLEREEHLERTDHQRPAGDR